MYYHLKIILRTMRRNITYSGINIAGLAIGITSSVLIFMWVYHELSFDRHYPGADRIYSISKVTEWKEWWGEKWKNENGDPILSHQLTMTISSNIPEVESIAAISAHMIEGIKIGEEVFPLNKSAVYVNKTWLELFDYKPVDGSFDAFGNHPFSVVLTETEAKKYFGNSRAVGQTVVIEGADYTVQAVVADNPSNSSFQYNVLASIDALKNDMEGENSWNWGWGLCRIFAKLHPSADVQQVCKKIDGILALDEGNPATALMRPLTDLHFATDKESRFFVPGNKWMVSIFGLLGILLLCTACINYVNLTTARANVRTKEIGIRKIVGARRSALFAYFLAESFIYCLIAVTLSLFFIWLLLPEYQALAGKTGFSLTSPVIWSIMGIILLVSTLLNGVYPALILSSFHPMNLMRGIGLLKMKSSNLRRGLVVFQFTLSAALIISVIVIYKQMQYVQNMNPGYNREHVVNVKISSEFVVTPLALQSVKSELLSNPNIDKAAICNDNITDIGGMIIAPNWEEGQYGCMMSVDNDYKQLLGLKLADGRWFNNNVADSFNVILNRTAIHEFNIREPYIGQPFQMGRGNFKIIGVVEDFHFKSLYEKIEPLILFYYPSAISLEWRYPPVITIKTHPGKHAEALQTAKSVCKKFFPNAPFDYAFLDDTFNKLHESDIRTAHLMLIFSLLTVVISMLGLFGLSTFAVERRSKEIGIRKVLGASVSSIVYMLTREFLVLVAIAFAIAAPVSWWAMSRWLDNFAYRIPFTVWIFVAGAVVTLVIALIAIGIQTVKAAMDNPVDAIKSE